MGGTLVVVAVIAAVVYVTNQSSDPLTVPGVGEMESAVFEEIASGIDTDGGASPDERSFEEIASDLASEDLSSDEPAVYGAVQVDGERLPPLDSGSDPAIGRVAPTIIGEDWDGNSHTIGADGRAKIVVLLAHWCPHCQREASLIQNWVDSGRLPSGVDLYGVTVLTNQDRDAATWPPRSWLESEGWTIPTLMDDELGRIVVAYGMSGVPMYLTLGPENQNLGRVSGEVGVEGLDALARVAVESLED